MIELAEMFIRDLKRKHDDLRVELGEDAREALRAYEWLGNVRELRNTIRQVTFLCRGNVIGAGNPRLEDRRVARRGRIEGLIAGGASYDEILDAVDKLFYAREFEADDRKLSRLAKSLGRAAIPFAADCATWGSIRDSVGVVVTTADIGAALSPVVLATPKEGRAPVWRWW